MHCVLLAAGVGRRLTEITGGGPKCLLPFAGDSLLGRHLRVLADRGVASLTVVTGCEPMQIEQALGKLVPERAPDMTVTTQFNPDFRAGSALSVLAASDILTGGDTILLMDADVLYDPRVLTPLIDGDNERDMLAVDRSVGADDDEAVKVAIRDDRPLTLTKTLPSGLAADAIGESAGFFRLGPKTARRVVEACRAASEADSSAAYEPALERVMQAAEPAFEIADITGLPWIEIDYPADVDRAADEIAPALTARGAAS